MMSESAKPEFNKRRGTLETKESNFYRIVIMRVTLKTLTGVLRTDVSERDTTWYTGTGTKKESVVSGRRT